MKCAILSDIHSNLEALTAAVHDLEELNIEKVYCAGDVVGYGPDPNEVIDLLRQLKAICVMGNHDNACFNKKMQDWMSAQAKQSIDYTKKVLSPENILYLASRPSCHFEKALHLVHGLPPQSMTRYLDLLYKTELKNAFDSFNGQIAFVGHTHLFFNYEQKNDGQIVKNKMDGLHFPLNPHSRYIVSAGSVGQPRDPRREAGYLVYDTNRLLLEKRLINYNVNLTIQKIKKANLPPGNGKRLLKK